MSFPGGSDGEASACNVGDPGLIPGLGRSPGEGNGNPLQYSCLENPTDGGAWQITVHGIAKSRAWLSTSTFRGKGYFLDGKSLKHQPPGLGHLSFTESNVSVPNFYPPFTRNMRSPLTFTSVLGLEGSILKGKRTKWRRPCNVIILKFLLNFLLPPSPLSF